MHLYLKLFCAVSRARAIKRMRVPRINLRRSVRASSKLQHATSACGYCFFAPRLLDLTLKYRQLHRGNFNARASIRARNIGKDAFKIKTAVCLGEGIKKREGERD